LLDLSEGMWVELVLEENQSQVNTVSDMYSVFNLYSPEGEGGSILVDDLTSEIRCSIVCMDLTGDRIPDEEDFMLVIASCGYPASLLEGGTGSRACLDGLFSTDDYVDLYDIMSWDWALSDEDRTYELLNLCEIPIFDVTSIMSLSSISMERIVGSISSPVELTESLSDLLVIGKRNMSDIKSKDSLCIFDNTGQYVGWSEPSPNRCNTKLIKGPDGKLYMINSNKGIISLDGAGEVIVPPGQTTYDNDPRYGKPASVYIGVQESNYSFFGRPVFDAAVDDYYVYVVPVLVKPQDANAYLAAAKLELFEEGEPPYQVVRLYDDLIDVNDNQFRNNLREIEIDEDGNVYVVNSNKLNNSDILWKYSSEGLLLDRLDLGYEDSNNFIPDPVAMHISDINDMVYIASGQYGEEPNSITIYGFSKEGFTLERTIKINDMQHITSITEDPVTGTLWVGGFNMYDVPSHFNPFGQAFYYPYIAEIPVGEDEVLSLPIYDPDNHDLAMPISIIWTGDN
jgi:hypothetical protein